jgi:glycerophosphoryl diester phosphodiesterase
VLDVLARYPGTQAAFSSFDWEVLARVRALDPNVELWVLTHTISDAAIQAAHRVGATTLAVLHLGITETSIEKAKNAGFSVMAWTVNDPLEAARLRDLGVIALCTDDPAVLVVPTEGEGPLVARDPQ